MTRVLLSTFLLSLFIASAGHAKVIEGEADAKKATQMKAYVEQVGDSRHDMLPIPGGVFTMGSPKNEERRNKDEGPPIKVKIEPFWMGKYEVTWDAYKAFRDEYPHTDKALAATYNVVQQPWDQQADAVTIPTPLWEQDTEPILKAIGHEGGYPLGNISQHIARQFTKWLSKKTGRFYRLPTEAEWEYACRAGTNTMYNFGSDDSDIDKHAWYERNSEYKVLERMNTHVDDRGYRKVDTLQPNKWGLYHMHGNVGEWVIDAYDANHYANLRKKYGDKPIDWKDAIRWSDSKTSFPHVIRGGHFMAYPDECRSASRLESEKGLQQIDPQSPKSVIWYTHAFHIGFRIVRPLVQPSDAEKAKFWDTQSSGIRHALKTRNGVVRKVIDAEK